VWQQNSLLLNMSISQQKQQVGKAQ
jgi:hypothetical protein